MKLYTKLKEEDLIHDPKEFSELVWIRCIKINDKPVCDPNVEIKKGDKIQIGFCVIIA
jgi:hypothetical protein